MNADYTLSLEIQLQKIVQIIIQIELLNTLTIPHFNALLKTCLKNVLQNIEIQFTNTTCSYLFMYEALEYCIADIRKYLFCM